MRSTGLEEQGVRRELERVLESSGFARNERLSRFLRFAVERHLDGKDEELKESVLAIEVFGRRSDFDPKQDPVVRTEAARLRARLTEYYADLGKSNPLVIELPKGGYIPCFREVESSRSMRRPARWRLLSAVAAVCLAAVAWWWIQHRAKPIPIAVLPLENTSHDPANDYFADGLTDELIRNLSMIEGLAVRSRTSSFAYKNRPRDIRELGQQLRVDYILEGSVLRAGEQLRIDVQLIRVRDDFSVWSAQFGREFNDVFAIQEEISLGIVNHLRLGFGLGRRRRYESSVEAYDLYLRARAIPDQRSQIPAHEAAAIYERVIEKDSQFAPAYAGLAAAYAATSAQSPVHHERAAGELAKMRTAAEKAIQLDPLLAEAHDALGMVYARDGQWPAAEKSFRRAIELDPNDAVTYADYTMWLLLPLDRKDEALKQIRIAEKVDPLSPRIQNVLGVALLDAGHYEEAAMHCEKGTEVVECVGRARLAQGRIDEAMRILKAEPLKPYLGYAYGRASRREEAEQLAAAVAPNPFSEAIIYAGLGDKDRTLEALDRATLLGGARIGRALTSPEFALLRDDARTKALRKRVGLPE